MYSLILMTAMGAAAPETPNYGLIRALRCGPAACMGCVGCWGGCSGGCWGWAARPYWGGCAGSCYGRGCWGSCAGCGGCVGCAGCYGSMPMTRAVWGANYYYSESRPFDRPSYVPSRVAPAGEPLPKPKSTSTSARIVIEVPANAKLYIDGQLLKDASGERLFYTPTLNPGEKYFYDVRIELVKNGKSISESKKVIVQAGDMLRESFNGLGEPTAVAASGKK